MQVEEPREGLEQGQCKGWSRWATSMQDDCPIGHSDKEGAFLPPQLLAWGLVQNKGLLKGNPYRDATFGTGSWYGVGRCDAHL